MALPDATDIIDRVSFWINRSDPSIPAKIHVAYNQKGGWEGWAQVEIAYLVQVKYANVTIDREVNVYIGTNKENDFVITDKNDAAKPKQIIELKCERGTQTPVQFRQSFIDDITKINTLPIGVAYIPAKAYALAISCTQQSYKLLMETEWSPDLRVYHVQCAADIWIWWYERDII